MKYFLETIKGFVAQAGNSEGDFKQLDTVAEVVKASEVESYIVSEAEMIGKTGDRNRHDLLVKNLTNIQRRAAELVEKNGDVEDGDVFAVTMVQPEQVPAKTDADMDALLKEIRELRKSVDELRSASKSEQEPVAETDEKDRGEATEGTAAPNGTAESDDKGDGKKSGDLEKSNDDESDMDWGVDLNDLHGAKTEKTAEKSASDQAYAELHDMADLGGGDDDPAVRAYQHAVEVEGGMEEM